MQKNIYIINNGIRLYLTTIENVKTDGYVFKVRKGRPTKKEYMTDGYCRTNKAYELSGLDDIWSYSYLKKGTKVFTEWEYLKSINNGLLFHVEH